MPGFSVSYVGAQTGRSLNLLGLEAAFAERVQFLLTPCCRSAKMAFYENFINTLLRECQL